MFSDPSGLKCGPAYRSPIGDTGLFFMEQDVSHPLLFNIVTADGRVIEKGAASVDQFGLSLSLYDIAGNIISTVYPVHTQDISGSDLQRKTDQALNSASLYLGQATAATGAQIYNAIAAVLDPYGYHPRMVDPLANP